MEPKLLRIKDWTAHFENNRTRELKHLEWAPVPNQMDGDGYTELLDHADGAAHFGAWIALVEIASKCKPRGVLVRSGPNDSDVPCVPQDDAAASQVGATLVNRGAKPHDAGSLSRICRIRPEVFTAAIPRLVSIGWLASEVVASSTVTQIPQEGAGTSAQSRTLLRKSAYGMEGNGREEKDPQAPASGGCALPAETQEAPHAGNGREHVDRAPDAARPETDPLPHGSPHPTNAGSSATDAKGDERRRHSRANAETEPQGFVRFWKAYPRGERKVGKSDCVRFWSRNGLEPIADRVVSALERSKSSRDWTKDGGAFIPLPRSWLGKTPWETDPDDLEPAEQSADENGFVRETPSEAVLRVALGLREDEEIPL